MKGRKIEGKSRLLFVHCCLPQDIQDSVVWHLIINSTATTETTEHIYYSQYYQNLVYGICVSFVFICPYEDNRDSN